MPMTKSVTLSGIGCFMSILPTSLINSRQFVRAKILNASSPRRTVAEPSEAQQPFTLIAASIIIVVNDKNME